MTQRPRPVCAWAVLTWILTIGWVRAEAPLTVGFHKSVSIAVSGATAAYSLDSHIADTTVANGVVQIYGTGQGTTSVIAVTPEGAVSTPVRVPAPPVIYPPGFQPPRREAGGESGTYEARYSSDPGQFTSALDLRRQEGKSMQRFRLVNANYLAGSSFGSPVAFPLVSYEIANATRDVVLVDQQVNNSPLTLDGPIVRGFHMQQGPWRFHAGFTSVASFLNYFLATNPEYVAGITREIKLSSHTTVAANFYYFRNPSKESQVAKGGAVGSVLYSYKPNKNFSVLAELGVSRGIGLAARANYDDARQRFQGDFRYEPGGFASLAVDSRRGLFTDVEYMRTLSDRFTASIRLDEADYNLTTFRQKTLTSSDTLMFKIDEHFSVTAGSAFSRFDSRFPTRFQLQTISGMTGIDYLSRHFSAGAQYQPTYKFAGPLANGYGANVGSSFAGFHAGGSFRHDVEIPAIVSIYSAVPGLQAALESSGIFVSDPDQLFRFLRNSASLAAIGFTNGLSVNLAPARDDLSVNAYWAGKSSSRQRVTLSFLNSKTELITSSFLFRMASAAYSRQLNSDNEIGAVVSAYQTVQGRFARFRPTVELIFRHRFSSVPANILPGRHGTIAGHVFTDSAGSGRYSERDHGMAAVDVRLDDNRIARTNNEGYYEFRRVAFGPHRVEGRVPDGKPFFFTTDSPANAEIDSIVDFGVSFLRATVFGSVVNDAGNGIPGVDVVLTGDSAPRHFQTGGDGRFSFNGILEGQYSVSMLPDSYPVGYDVSILSARVLSVRADHPGQVSIVVRALRSVSGVVSRYDVKTLATVPVGGVEVMIPELSLVTKTDGAGRYLFRDLPAGVCTLKVMQQGREFVRQMNLPGEPVSLGNVNFSLSAR